MKMMKVSFAKSAVQAFAIAALAVLAACGQNSSISNSSDTPGAGSLGSNVDIRTCQVGQVHNSQLGCLTRGQCAVGQGVAANSGQCQSGQIVTEEIKFGSSAGTRHFGQLNFTNLTQAQLLFQAAGLCNSGMMMGAVATSALSSTPCSQWIQRGGFAIVKSFSTGVANVNLQIGVGSTFPTDLVPVLPGVYGYNANYANTNYLSFSQQAMNSKYNNGNGMQIVGVSPNGKVVNIVMLVDAGDLGADRVQAQLVYQGVIFANATLNRF